MSAGLPPLEGRPLPEATVDWFEGPKDDRPGLLNLAYNALDRHVIRGLADEPALLHPFAAAGVRSYYSYAELLERVAQLAGGFRELGVRPGRTIVLALPLIPELVMGLLACARVGAVAVPLLDEAPGAVRRLGRDPAIDAPAVVLVDSGRKPAVDEVLTAAGRTADFQVVLRPEPGSLDPGLGDIDLAVVMRPGAFQPGVCAELRPDSPFLLHATDAGTTTYDHGWTLDLLAAAASAAMGQGTYVTPGTDLLGAVGEESAPYAALLAPLLVGAAVELR